MITWILEGTVLIIKKNSTWRSIDSLEWNKIMNILNRYIYLYCRPIWNIHKATIFPEVPPRALHDVRCSQTIERNVSTSGVQLTPTAMHLQRGECDTIARLHREQTFRDVVTLASSRHSSAATMVAWSEDGHETRIIASGGNRRQITGFGFLKWRKIGSDRGDPE